MGDLAEDRDSMVTVQDHHHMQVGRAVMEALSDADPKLWFDVGVALATDDRVREAVRSADLRGRRMSPSEREVMLDDLDEILRALGLGDHARPDSPHEVVQREVLPAIERMMGKREALNQAIRESESEGNEVPSLVHTVMQDWNRDAPDPDHD